MDDRWAAITEWAQHASEFRPLKAYVISQDGTFDYLIGRADGW